MASYRVQRLVSAMRDAVGDEAVQPLVDATIQSGFVGA
jgi:hypothetical protein